MSLTPVLGLALVGALAQSLYAGYGNNPCFRPRLEVFSQCTAPNESTTGDAEIKMKFKPPFIIEGMSRADGYGDEDSGASGGQGAAGTSRFWTPTCPGWSYGWGAKGGVQGALKSHAGKASGGAACAVCSFSATAAGDLSPAASDSKTAANATADGTSVTISAGVGPEGPSFGIGMTTTSQTVSPSTNPAGDATSLMDGPKSNMGAGPETLVVVNLFQAHNSQAGASWNVSHILKSSATTGGFAGAAVEQDLFAKDPNGVEYGMAVHPQTGFWTYLHKDAGGVWVTDRWKPPVGMEFNSNGPDEGTTTTPPLPPDDSKRTRNDGPLHKI